MTEAMRDSFLSAGAPARAGAWARAANGAPLRFTPGPDERRLPSSEDEPVPWDTRQAVAIVDCFDGLRQHWRGRLDVFVGLDQFLYWDPAYKPGTEGGNPPVAPDVYVAFDVANRHRNSYVVWEEGKPPDFVLEVASDSSRRKDVKEKPCVYAKIGVPEFFLYDPEGKLTPALSGFELRGGAGGACRTYQRLPEERLPGGAVGVRSKVPGLCLCVRSPGPEPLDGSLCWYDPAASAFLPTRHELADCKRRAEARADASDGRAEAAEARAEAAGARVAELESQIEKMRRG